MTKDCGEALRLLRELVKVTPVSDMAWLGPTEVNRLISVRDEAVRYLAKKAS